MEVQANISRVESELESVAIQINAGTGNQARVRAGEAFRTTLADVQRKIADGRARGLGALHPEMPTLAEEEREVQKLIADAGQGADQFGKDQ